MTESPSSSGQMINPENSSRKGTCIRILCLHGKGGDGKQFLDKSLMPLRSSVEKRLAYDSSKDDVEHRITIECSILYLSHPRVLYIHHHPRRLTIGWCVK